MLNYKDISELPLFNLLMFLRAGDKKHMSRLGIGRFVDNEHCEALVDDYITHIGDPIYLIYKKKRNDLINMKYGFERIKLAGIILAHKKSEHAERILKEHKVLNKPKKIELKLKSLIIRIGVLEMEYGNFFKKDEKQGRDVVREATGRLMTLSKWQGYHLDMKKITALEYADLLNKYNSEIRNGR